MRKVVAAVVCICMSGMPASGGLKLWYDKAADATGLASPLKCWEFESKKRTNKKNPDQAWEKYALPVGNGFVGAMVYGGVELERIQFNEHTLWSGGAGSPGYMQNQNIMDAYTHLPEIRAALLAGDSAKAQKLSTEYLRGLGLDDRDKSDVNFGRYETFGELTIATDHNNKKWLKNYRRELDISTGIATVQYNYHGSVFRREVFCSYPDRCLVMNFTADKYGLQNLKLAVASPHNIKYSEEDGVLVASGVVDNNGLKLDARIGVAVRHGRVAIDGDSIVVAGADNALFVLVAGTDYAPVWPDYRGMDPAGRDAQTLEKALALGYEHLKKRHVDDFGEIFNRVELDLGETAPDIKGKTTDRRLKLNVAKPDPDLEELYFQYGRYLLISSSRPGGVPANLQGIWCNERVPAWNSDYHFNINLQMNYWPSGPCRLSECQQALLDYIDGLRKPGAVTAKAYSNAAGWTANLRGNLWGYTCPSAGRKRPRFWAYFPLAGAWLSTHAWEQYAFTHDDTYLRQTGWPILESTAQFLADYLYKLPNGEYTSIPSWSPEHGPISRGTTADIAIAREALKDALAAAHAMGIDDERTQRWRDILENLVPYKIGKYGQLQEWYEDIDDPKSKHRHINHLFGLYPGSQINQSDTPKLIEAAGVTLEQRGDGATGWSMGWKINFWARMHDGNHAYLLLRNLLRRGTNPNLLDVHPPFQIDGNFGGCAGIAEMLLQSRYTDNGGDIILLPALPDVWKNGRAIGLGARGAAVVDIKWSGGRLSSYRIKSLAGGKYVIRYGEHRREVVLERGGEFKGEDREWGPVSEY